MKQASVDVLDEADRFEDILTWQLFKADQEQMLRPRGERVAIGPDDWEPGIPIHKRPSWASTFTGEQFVRPMVEEMAIDHFHIPRELSMEFPRKLRCEPCQTYWSSNDPCFACGEDRPLDEFMAYKTFMNAELERAVAEARSYVQPSTEVRRLMGFDVEEGEARTVSFETTEGLMVFNARDLSESLERIRPQLPNMSRLMGAYAAAAARAGEQMREVYRSMWEQIGRSLPPDVPIRMTMAPRRNGRSLVFAMLDEINRSDTVRVNGIRVPRNIPTQLVIAPPEGHIPVMNADERERFERLRVDRTYGRDEQERLRAAREQL